MLRPLKILDANECKGRAHAGPAGEAVTRETPTTHGSTLGGTIQVGRSIRGVFGRHSPRQAAIAAGVLAASV